MRRLEKRHSPRQSVQIPLRFHSEEMQASDPEIISETVNASRTGLFMRSPLRLKVDEALSLTLRVPTHFSGSALSEVRCTGRVIHERRLPSGDLGYGIHFEEMLNFQGTARLASEYSSP